MMENHIKADSVIAQLRGDFGKSVALYERRPGAFQVILPMFHEDGGHMLDVYLQGPALSIVR